MLYSANLQNVIPLTGATSAVIDLAWSPDGTRLASCGGSGGNGELFIWDVLCGERVRVIAEHSNLISAVVWNSGGDLLVSGGSDGRLRWWQMPLAVTGLMLMYPIASSRFFPGWALNIASLLHRAEALLAVTYIFIVHFFIGHLRPSSFPMNEAMFSGSVPMEEAIEEKPAWVERIQGEGRLGSVSRPTCTPLTLVSTA